MLLSFFKRVSGDESVPSLSREAKRLLKRYKKLFDSFAEQNRNNASSEEIWTRESTNDQKYLINRTVDDKPFVIVTDNILDGIAEADWVSTVKQNLATKYPNGVVVGNSDIRIDAKSRKEMTFSKYMQWVHKNDPSIYADKLKATNNVDEILKATTDWVGEALLHPRNDDIIEFARGNVLLRVGNNDYTAEVVVGTRKNGQLRLYDVLYLTPTQIKQKKTSKAIPANPSPEAKRKTSEIFNISIPENTENVKALDEKYIDAVEKGDMQAVQEMVDEAAKEAGYTIRSYHGTLAKDFTEFKKSFIGSRFSFDDKGFFFIDRKSIAEDYASSEFDSKKKGRVLDVYLRVKKPLLVDKQFCLREGLGNPFRENDVIDVWDAYSEFFKEEAEARRVDGIILDDGMSKMTVVFDGEQVKSADPVTYDDNGEVIPLSKRFDSSRKDIRYAKPEGVDARQYTYEELVAKGDLTGTVIDDTLQVKVKTDSNGYVKIDSVAVFDAVKLQCEQIKTNAPLPTYYVNVPDIGRNVEIYPNGVNHGFSKGLRKNQKSIPNSDMLNARVSLKLPEILKKSIEVNISERSGNIDIPYSHVMMGTAAIKNDDGTMEYYAVRSVIEERINQNPILAEAKVVGRLHAVNAKKVGSFSVQVAKNGVALQDNDAYTYNISQFLEDVKGVFDDTFSNDVYQTLGERRRTTPFSQNLRFAMPEGVKVEKTPTAASVTTEKKEVYQRGFGEASRSCYRHFGDFSDIYGKGMANAIPF